LVSFGFDEIIINVHHFADDVEKFIREKENYGISIRFSDERSMLLDTGGGLKKASWFFNDNESFLVHNVDVISGIDLNHLMENHRKSNAIATLAVSNRKSSRYLLFSESGVLGGWQNISTGEKIINRPEIDLFPYAFSGIHVIHPSLFKYIRLEGSFPIIDAYLSLPPETEVRAYDHSGTFWLDLGIKENLEKAEKLQNLL
jgi:NDP-sugar pyrophosphorylase family protein